ncbi:hypothetical protein GCM10009854_02100 [Saccharopolyspora halophila]|uniref:Uncharacterized protein n=1 Tax=Saccharopolyspora halophila TaxID=405551 RepID=A0ABP5SGN4_9PSEU
MTTAGDSPSEAVAAARRKFEETSNSAAARVSASAQASAEAGKKANESNERFTEDVQKIDRRVRELIDKRAQDALRENEIQVGGEDDEEPQDEIAIEFKDLIENYPIARPAETTPAAAETTGVPQADTSPAAQPDDRTPPPDPKWQVQAGRFGRRDQQQAQQAPPPAAPKPPAQPKPAPRRQRPAFDDDDDYENQTWLR